MSWTCPSCKRTFSRNKQWHSCEKHDIDLLFADKPGYIRELYDYLISQIKELGPIDIHVAKWNINIRAASTFLNVVPEKKDLSLSIASDKAIDDFPVYASHQYSKHRWSNHVKIEEKEEIDSQLMGWIKQAYILCSPYL